jgi:hypothetical protein
LFLEKKLQQQQEKPVNRGEMEVFAGGGDDNADVDEESGKNLKL